jgi:hypothetical protein
MPSRNCLPLSFVVTDDNALLLVDAKTRCSVQRSEPSYADLRVRGRNQEDNFAFAEAKEVQRAMARRDTGNHAGARHELGKRQLRGCAGFYKSKILARITSPGRLA